MSDQKDKFPGNLRLQTLPTDELADGLSAASSTYVVPSPRTIGILQAYLDSRAHEEATPAPAPAEALPADPTPAVEAPPGHQEFTDWALPPDLMSALSTATPAELRALSTLSMFSQGPEASGNSEAIPMSPRTREVLKRFVDWQQSQRQLERTRTSGLERKGAVVKD